MPVLIATADVAYRERSFQLVTLSTTTLTGLQTGRTHAIINETANAGAPLQHRKMEIHPHAHGRQELRQGKMVERERKGRRK